MTPPIPRPPGPDEVTLSRAGTRRVVASPTVRLRVVWPPNLPPVALAPGRQVFGRSPAPDPAVVLPEGTISRSHAALVLDEATGRAAVTDLESRNGTWIDGEPVKGTPRALADQSVLRMGDVVMVFERSTVAIPNDIEIAELPGHALAVTQLRHAVHLCARSDAPVLIAGETGTGKEFVARALHRLSGRGGPFLAVNCAALAPHLIESQLFGHARGAFTSALEARPGLFRAAHGGTLLLDEVGELSLELQPKLLRVLQEREVLPIGETRPVPVDVRVLAASQRDLGGAVEAGSFRRDLLARLRLTEVVVPPLRARRADVLDWYLRLARRWDATADAHLGLTADLVERLLLEPWPDNLRGLDRIAHLGVRAPGLAAAFAHPPSADDPIAPPPARPPKPDAATLRALLDTHGGSVHAVARALQRDRKQVYRWMSEYGLSRP